MSTVRGLSRFVPLCEVRVALPEAAEVGEGSRVTRPVTAKKQDLSTCHSRRSPSLIS